MKPAFLALFAMIATVAPIHSLAQSTPSSIHSPVPAPVPKDTPTFTAPPGWVSQPVAMALSGFTMLSVWKAPPSLGAGDNLGLGFAPAPPGSSSMADLSPTLNAMYAKMFGPGNPVASHAEKLCGGTSDGWYLENKVTFGALNLISEQTMIIGPFDTFAATYTRQSSEKEDPAARSALDTLCIKPAASPA